MQHRDREYLIDILESARIALTYIEGRTRQEFLEDVQNQDAVIRRLEVIGEAARRLSEQTKTNLPGIPWAEVIGMRNFLIHKYDDVDLTIVWDTLHLDLASVISSLEAYL